MSSKYLYMLMLAVSLFLTANSRTVKYRVTHEVGGGSKIKAIEGTNIQYDCVAIADDKPAPPYPGVVQTTSGETKNTSRITVTNRIDGLKAITTVKYHPIQVSDAADSYICGPKGTLSGTHFEMIVIPKKSLPKVDLTSQSSLTFGSKATFKCNASAEDAGIKITLTLKWTHIKQKGQPGKDISKEATTTPSQKIGKIYNISSVLTRTVQDDSAGVYVCDVSANLKDVSFDYSKNTSLAVPVHFKKGMQPKQKLKVYKGKEAKMVCGVHSSPAASVTWKKGGQVITAASDSRYNFANDGTTANGVFVIKNVQYKDRAVYYCIVSNPISSKMAEFTLRVRDPLGALWPFIGIVIEAIVLAVIIVVYEKFKPAKGSKRSKEHREKETSPLLPADKSSGVEYTVGAKGTGDSVMMHSGESANA